MTIKRIFSGIIGVLLLSLIINSCKKTETTDPTKVTASFTTDKEKGDSPLIVKFSNASTNATTYLWDFGDGTATSIEIDPTHIFVNKSTISAANFTVTLTATHEDYTTANRTKVISLNKSTNATNGNSTAVFNSTKTFGTMIDQEGNVYKTIIIGTQTWMAENLRTTIYRDGTAIPKVTDQVAWRVLTTDGCCPYNYDGTADAVSVATYGRLYNWYAVTDGHNISPEGWHVPTDAEWNTLTTQLGGESVAGGKMKETDKHHWIAPNTDASNESGFTALPSGFRDGFDGEFYGLRNGGGYWSSTTNGAEGAYFRSIYYNSAVAYRYGFLKTWGFSIRCVKD